MYRSLVLAFVLLGPVAVKAESRIKLDSEIKRKYKDLIKKDLKLLKNMDFWTSGSATFLELMEMNSLDHLSLEKWLFTRVRYIVPEFSEKVFLARIGVVEKDYFYENRSEISKLDIDKQYQKNAPVLIMSNLGTGLYFFGKSTPEKYLIGLKIHRGLSRQKVISITSPRVGIIQIGKGLFLKRFEAAKKSDHPVNSLMRLATFFHEARHSDGNGKSLGFMHDLCPKGHSYQGLYACDRNLNGPYTVGGHIQVAFALNCSGCNYRQRSVLLAKSADSFNRVIKETLTKNGKLIPSVNWDASPEGRR